jgi:hypothetical protein
MTLRGVVISLVNTSCGTPARKVDNLTAICEPIA